MTTDLLFNVCVEVATQKTLIVVSRKSIRVAVSHITLRLPEEFSHAHNIPLCASSRNGQLGISQAKLLLQYINANFKIYNATQKTPIAQK